MVLEDTETGEHEVSMMGVIKAVAHRIRRIQLSQGVQVSSNTGVTVEWEKKPGWKREKQQRCRNGNMGIELSVN